MSNALFAETTRSRFIDGLEAASCDGHRRRDAQPRRPSFLNNPPERVELQARAIGHSGPAIRPGWNGQALTFFGPQIFEFSLADAIKAGCLTPYRYYVHEVELTDEEMQKYSELTDEIRGCRLRIDDDGQTIVSERQGRNGYC